MQQGEPADLTALHQLAHAASQLQAFAAAAVTMAACVPESAFRHVYVCRMCTRENGTELCLSQGYKTQNQTILQAHHLQQDAFALAKAAQLQMLQIQAPVSGDVHDVHLVFVKAVHRVILRIVAAIPGMPLPGQHRAVLPLADAQAKKLHKAGGHILPQLTLGSLCADGCMLVGTTAA